MDINMKNREKKTRKVLTRFRKFYETNSYWSLRKIAKELEDLSRGSVHNYLAGRCTPTTKHLLEIEEFLNKYDIDNKETD